MKTLAHYCLLFGAAWLPFAGYARGQVLLNSYRFAAPLVYPSYVINQNFEGTGYDNSETWTEAGTGTVDEDYTGVVLAGSQSLRLNTSATTAQTFSSFTASNTAYARFRFERVSNAATATIFAFRTSAGTSRGTVQVTTAGLLRSQSSGGSTNDSSTGIPVNTPVYVWAEYEKGTGANAITRAGWSLTTAKPALSAGGVASSISSDGTGTDQVARDYCGSTATSSTVDLIFDEVLVALTTIP